MYSTDRELFGKAVLEALTLRYDEELGQCREINDTHKVFTICYAFKANFPNAYAGIFDYVTGEFADWIMMADQFYLDKIDGVWHLTSVGMG